MLRWLPACLCRWQHNSGFVAAHVLGPLCMLHGVPGSALYDTQGAALCHITLWSETCAEKQLALGACRQSVPRRLLVATPMCAYGSACRALQWVCLATCGHCVPSCRTVLADCLYMSVVTGLCIHVQCIDSATRNKAHLHACWAGLLAPDIACLTALPAFLSLCKQCAWGCQCGCVRMCAVWGLPSLSGLVSCGKPTQALIAWCNICMVLLHSAYSCQHQDLLLLAECRILRFGLLFLVVMWTAVCLANSVVVQDPVSYSQKREASLSNAHLTVV